MASNPMYVGLVAAQLGTLAAYVVVTAGAALLQKKANNLTLFDNLDANTTLATRAVYDDVFQSTTYIIPYPQRPQYQFQYQWWIIEFELFIFCITALCTVFPKLITRVRPVALTFLASALVLVMDNVNAIFYLIRSDLAKNVFGAKNIKLTQAGLIMVAVYNCLTIIFLGLYQDETAHNDDANAYIGNNNNANANAKRNAIA